MSNMVIISLGQRLISTIIDKVLISIIFVIVAFIFCLGMPGAELGHFVSQLGIEYKKIEFEKTIYEHNVEVNNWLKENGYSEMMSTDQDYEHYKTMRDVYDKYVWIFVVVNILYYLLCEFIFKASLGKRLMKCRIKKGDGRDIDKRDVFTRFGILASLLLLAVALHMTMNINGYITTILFFAILDFTVFTKQMSLVDKYSDTLVVKQKK